MTTFFTRHVYTSYERKCSTLIVAGSGCRLIEDLAIPKTDSEGALERLRNFSSVLAFHVSRRVVGEIG